MKSENRIIKSSIMTGISEVCIGLFMAITGWHQWYFDTFHFFGVLGVGMFLYGIWHSYYLKKETGEDIWIAKQTRL